ncbi:hypothetical protein M427DRAFT_54476 [Gonapodya prolifera JEL478]|uniref:Bromodomain-containing protein n=1 Tax=Gonapodya prolifera (strain JEL478) TaxID=1344416 RepID=A0A139AL57_GONPJ|nr:hypothetical protein M427DRAFT_54476 [Gonapodya prolifera JEL478]|eukprot:KXS17531.1 hypothetical protein M427DRAFT_54476 [Gonapodya prolifera JEL478]
MDFEMATAVSTVQDPVPQDAFDSQEAAMQLDDSADMSREPSSDEAESEPATSRAGNGMQEENGHHGGGEYAGQVVTQQNGFGAPAPTVPSGNGLTKAQQKYLQGVVKNLKGLKDAYAFLQPVDPIRLNIPDYFTFVKKPMDLGTVGKRLEGHEYKSVDEFKAEMDLIWRNCYLYNGRQSPVSMSAANLEAKFESLMKNCPKEGEELPKAHRYSAETRGLAPFNFQPLPSRKASSKPLNPVDLGPARETYLELVKSKYNQDVVWFSLPVDPVQLGIPHYFDIIKHPMDLSTIRRKLDHQEYDSVDGFAADVRLMLSNCFTFNPPDTPVYQSGKRLEKVFEDKWREVNRAAYGLPKKSKKERRPEPEEFSDSDSDSDSDSSDSDSDTDSDSNSKKVKQLEEKMSSIFKQIEMLKAKGDKKRKRKERKEKRKEKKKKREERRSTGGGYYEKSKKLDKRPKPLPMTAPLPLPAPPMPYVAPPARPAPPPAVPKPAAPSAPKKQKKNHDGPPKKKVKKVERMDDTGPFPIEMKHKQYLTDQINSMSETNQEHLGRVFQIIQENVPNLAGADQGEVELDIDALDQKTLWALYDFVRKLPGRAPGPGMGNMNTNAAAGGESSSDDSDSDSSDSDAHTKSGQKADQSSNPAVIDETEKSLQSMFSNVGGKGPKPPTRPAEAVSPALPAKKVDLKTADVMSSLPSFKKVEKSSHAVNKSADSKSGDAKAPDSKPRGNTASSRPAAPQNPALGGFDFNKLLEDTAEDRKLKELAEQKRKMEEEAERRRERERERVSERSEDQRNVGVDVEGAKDKAQRTMDPQVAREAKVDYEKELEDAQGLEGEMDLNRQNCLMAAFERVINGNLTDGHHYPPRDGIENALKKARESMTDFVPTF